MLIKYWILKARGYLRRKRSNDISRSAFLARNVQILGIQNVAIGDNSTIGENCTFTVNDRSEKRITLSIGNNVYIGRNNFFAVGASIEIGDYCIFGNNCSIMCSDHVFDSPLIPYRLSGSTTSKRIKVGVNCWFGINVTVIGDVQIGHGVIIGANSLINKDIPPFSVVVGNPGRVIKRFDFTTNSWVKGESVKDSLYFDETSYLSYLKENFGSVSKAYHSCSSQFGDI